MQKVMKCLHTAGAVGITGAVAAHLVLLGVLPDFETLAEAAGIAALAPWLLHSEWGPLWVILAICIANIVLGIWRPRLRRQRPSDAELPQAA